MEQAAQSDRGGQSDQHYQSGVAMRGKLCRSGPNGFLRAVRAEAVMRLVVCTLRVTVTLCDLW
jgi:hypothetical protein